MAKTKLAYLYGLFLCALLCLTPGAMGQVQPETSGVLPFSTIVAPDKYEAINLQNLNIMLKIPVRSKKQVSSSFDFSLIANSGYYIHIDRLGAKKFTLNNLNNFLQGAPSSPAPPPYGYYARIAGHDTTAGKCLDNATATTYYTNFYSIDSQGTHHQYPNVKLDTTHCYGTTANVPASDQSGFTLHANMVGTVLTQNVTDKAGNVMALGSTSDSGKSTDPNGNVVSEIETENFTNFTYNSVYTDNMGMTPITTGNNGIGGTQGLPTTYSYVDGTGTNRTVSVNNLANLPIYTNFLCTGISDNAAGQSFPSSVVMPDGSSFALTYEITPGRPTYYTGRIASLTLPTGGVVSYAYSGGNNGINCVDGSNATVTRTTPDGVWTYTHVPPVGSAVTSTTTVTDPAGNQTVYTFAGIYQITKSVYQGPAASNVLLYSENDCYNTSTNCGSVAIVPPINIKYVHYGPTGVTHAISEIHYDLNGSVTEDKEYDFGGTTLLTDVVTVYGTNNSGTCVAIGNNIVGLPCSITTKDAGGVTKAQTLVTYDPKGNPTAIKYLVTGSTYLTRNLTYNSLGLVLTDQDVNGTVTTSTYGACSGELPTQKSVTLNSLALNYTWNCDGAVQTSVQDVSMNTSYAGFQDPRWRASSVTDEAGNITSATYTNNAVESAITFSGSTNDVLTTLDSFGRQAIVQHRLTPAGSNWNTASKSFFFDTTGFVSRVTLPCVATTGASCPTTPSTLTHYDGDGRVVLIADGGTGTTSFAYTNNDVLVTVGPAPTGENTKRRQLEFNSLGWLTSVCELSSATGSGSCGQTTAATGFVTRYTYNALGQLTGVTQGVQTRTYAYDLIGRMTSETNPETGTTQYFYDSAPASPGYACATVSAGDLVKSFDANGNTRCLAYDALHRLTQSFYSGPNSDGTAQYFVYDSATVNGINMANARGRLAEAFTATCLTCAKITDIGLSYTVRGETADTYESTPHSAGYYHVGQTYWPNGAVNQLTALGLPAITYSLNGEGRVSAVFSMTGQNPVSSVTYTAAGQASSISFGSGDTQAGGFDPNTGRQTSYTTTINGVSTQGTLTWNGNGSLSRLVVTDPFNAADAQTCNYTHDDLERISTANCGAVWNQTFTYDQYGNITKSGSLAWMPGYTAGTNRYSLGGTSYDANGNLLNDTLHTYAWGADNRAKSIDATQLTYDALGRLVEVANGSAFKEYVYGLGQRLATMNGQTLVTPAYIPLPGGTQAALTSSGVTSYREADWLGSIRVTSSTTRTYLSGTAYAPFGETYAGLNSPAVAFTGQNTNETNSADEDFLFRELNGGQGRWLSPDPAGTSAARALKPQTWNRYAYVSNQPLSSTDPLGLAPECTSSSNTKGDISLSCTYHNEDLFAQIVGQMDENKLLAYIRYVRDKGGLKDTLHDLGNNREFMWVIGMAGGPAIGEESIAAELQSVMEERGGNYANGWFSRLSASNWFKGAGDTVEIAAPAASKLTGSALTAAAQKAAGADTHFVSNVIQALYGAQEGIGKYSVDQLEGGLNMWLNSNGTMSLRDAMLSFGVKMVGN